MVSVIAGGVQLEPLLLLQGQQRKIARRKGYASPLEGRAKTMFDRRAQRGNHFLDRSWLWRQRDRTQLMPVIPDGDPCQHEQQR